MNRRRMISGSLLGIMSFQALHRSSIASETVTADTVGSLVRGQVSRTWGRPGDTETPPFGRLHTRAFQFEDQEIARSALQSIVEINFADEDYWRFSGVGRLSAPTIGSKSLAMGGELTFDSGGSLLYIDLAIVNEACVVELLAVSDETYGIDATTSLSAQLEIANRISDREISESEMRLENKMAVGGLFDLLPGFADMPIGFAIWFEFPDLATQPWLAWQSRSGIRNWRRARPDSDGVDSFIAEAAEFTTEERAADALTLMVNYRASDRYYEVEQLEASEIHDQSFARTGLCCEEVDPSNTRWVALGYRTGAFVTVLTYGQLAESSSSELMLTELANIAQLIGDRVPGDNEPSITGVTMEGGLYDMLPTIEEIPEGFEYE